MSPRVLSVMNQKGGVGKTTCAVHLAAALAKQGHRVALIDNDPQHNLTSQWLSMEDIPPTALRVQDLYLSRASEKKELHPVRRDLWLIPGDGQLVGLEIQLQSKMARENILKNGLQHFSTLLKDIELFIIDNPPSLNLLTLNALVASTHVLVPVQLEFFSLEGLAQVRKTIEDVRVALNPELKLLGVLPNMVQPRRRLNQEVWQVLEEAFPKELLKTSVRMSVSVPEAAGHAQTLYEYAPSSTAAMDYYQVAEGVWHGLQ